MNGIVLDLEQLVSLTLKCINTVPKDIDESKVVVMLSQTEDGLKVSMGA